MKITSINGAKPRNMKRWYNRLFWMVVNHFDLSRNERLILENR